MATAFGKLYESVEVFDSPAEPVSNETVAPKAEPGYSKITRFHYNQAKKITVAVCLFGIAVSIFALGVLIRARVVLGSFNSANAELQVSLDEIQMENSEIKLIHDKTFDNSDTYTYATMILKMQLPEESQIRYLDSSVPVVYETSHTADSAVEPKEPVYMSVLDFAKGVADCFR